MYATSDISPFVQRSQDTADFFDIFKFHRTLNNTSAPGAAPIPFQPGMLQGPGCGYILLNEATVQERMPENSMGISFGQTFRCGVFALTKVSNYLQKRNTRPVFHNKICLRGILSLLHLDLTQPRGNVFGLLPAYTGAMWGLGLRVGDAG